MLKTLDNLWIVLLILFVFGWLFDATVAWLHERDWSRGYTAFLVVFGVGITIVGIGTLLGVEVGLVVFFCFCASGTPMIIGDVVRHLKDRSQADAELRELLRESDRG